MFDTLKDHVPIHPPATLRQQADTRAAPPAPELSDADLEALIGGVQKTEGGTGPRFNGDALRFFAQFIPRGRII